MKIVFMGTPDFAVPCLQAILDDGHEVCGVFTQPDKPKGRGYTLTPPPVKELALQYHLPVYQPNTLRTGEAYEILKELSPDLIAVVAYGKLLPKEILDLPPMGCVNVHGSLLPKYRGAAPIQWAVLNGDKVTGVTTMFMAEGMDTGDILLTAETAIPENETSGELFDRLKDMGAELLVKTIHGLEKGELTPIPQNEAEATHAPMLSKELSTIDWTASAWEVHNKVRGLSPWPTAHTLYHGKRMKVLETEVFPEKNGEPGKAFSENGEFFVYCGSGAVRLITVQPENSKRMAGKAFLLGHPLDKNTVLG